MVTYPRIFRVSVSKTDRPGKQIKEDAPIVKNQLRKKMKIKKKVKILRLCRARNCIHGKQK